MARIAHRFLAAAAFCGALAMPAFGQSVDVKGDTAGATALTERGVTSQGTNTTAGVATGGPDLRREFTKASQDPDAHIVPKPTPNGGRGNIARLNGDESADTPGADLKNLQGADAQAVRSADATAHRTVYDPNNQLGTSLEGHTRPIPGPVPGASADASTDTSMGASADAQVAAPQ